MATKCLDHKKQTGLIFILCRPIMKRTENKKAGGARVSGTGEKPDARITGGIPMDEGTWRRLLGRVRRLVRSDDQAEDILQSAFLRLEEYRVSHPVANPDAFVVRAAGNLVVDEFRRRRVRKNVLLDVADLGQIPDAHPLQHEVFDARQRLDRVRRGIHGLPPRTREVFLMHRLDGLKYREIAERLDISVSAVEKHVARAMLCLAELMEGQRGPRE
jgi:RNA polymerase sigma-70 factor (ECF subfamily)